MASDAFGLDVDHKMEPDQVSPATDESGGDSGPFREARVQEVLWCITSPRRATTYANRAAYQPQFATLVRSLKKYYGPAENPTPLLTRDRLSSPASHQLTCRHVPRM